MSKLVVLANFDKNWRTVHESLGIDRSISSNQPELRQELVLSKLNSFDKVVNPPNELTADKIKQLGIHLPNYIDFLQNAYQSWRTNDLTKCEYDNHFCRPGQETALFPVTIYTNKKEDFHECTPEYMKIGNFTEDWMTPIYQNTFDIALQSANNCYIAHKYLEKYDIVYCLNQFPGHHAGPSSFAGFCFLNNACFVQGERIAILDVDYHAHSNGTQNIDKSMLAISIHANPALEYPWYCGFENETSQSNQNSSINIVFPNKATWTEYEHCLDKAIKLINDYNPTILVIALGLDTLEGDPDANLLAGCCLKIEDFTKMGQKLAKLPYKKIITAEGGYNLDLVPEAVLNFLTALVTNPKTT